MRKADIREARQDPSALIECVKKGREITITEQARLWRSCQNRARKKNGLPDLTGFWSSLGAVSPRASDRFAEIVEEDRNDRL